MISEIDSSRRSGSNGPRPMISSVICSSIRTRSARVRARPSSSMTLPKIYSIWRRTSTWVERSSLGSRSWMTRFWIRNLTSRNDSRVGAWDISLGAAGAAGAAGPPAGGAAPPPGGEAGTGMPAPPGSWPGRALSIRFSRDIATTPSSPPRAACSDQSSPCEQRFLRCRLLFGLGFGCRRHGRRRPCRRCPPAGGGESQDVLRDLGLAVGQEERDATIERVDHAPTVAHDRVIHLPADRVLHIRDPDAEGRIRPVEHEPDLARRVAQLLCNLQEEAHVLDARDLEAQQGQDLVRRVEDPEGGVVERRGAVDDDEVVLLSEPLHDASGMGRRDELVLLPPGG